MVSFIYYANQPGSESNLIFENYTLSDLQNKIIQWVLKFHVISK